MSTTLNTAKGILQANTVLIYWERFEYIEHAINREKEIKGWTRKKKELLIQAFNPKWNFLNDTV